MRTDTTFYAALLVAVVSGLALVASAVNITLVWDANTARVGRIIPP